MGMMGGGMGMMGGMGMGMMGGGMGMYGGGMGIGFSSASCSTSDGATRATRDRTESARSLCSELIAMGMRHCLPY